MEAYDVPIKCVNLSVPLGYRLDHKICHKPEKKKHDPVNLVIAVGQPGLC